MHVLTQRILENGSIAMETTGEGIVATKPALKGTWKGILSRTSSKARRSEEGLGMEYVEANGE